MEKLNKALKNLGKKVVIRKFLLVTSQWFLLLIFWHSLSKGASLAIFYKGKKAVSVYF